MDPNRLYSIRMHASAGEKHVSGAERIVSGERIDRTVNALIARAVSKSCKPDRITVNIDCIESVAIRNLTSLDLVTIDAPDATTGRQWAMRFLEETGVSPLAAREAIALLTKGPALSGKTMRGAMILDAEMGNRLEPDRERGVRTSRFDWSDEANKKISRLLSEAGLTHFRTCEALALATKVASAPGIIAELCWSDDPDYTAGYVASRGIGYVRFPYLKEHGNDRGGRAFFVRHLDFDRTAFIRFLEEEPALIADVGTCGTPVAPGDISNLCLNRNSQGSNRTTC